MVKIGLLKKERLDRLLVQRSLAPTREKAQRLILAGKVAVDDELVDKCGRLVDTDAKIEVTGQDRYVSRGGIKLERALLEFKVDVRGKIALDIGASTGGFTDCLLQNGASKVYAIDVGYGQLDWKLRNDPRVIAMERVNARYLRPGDLPEVADLATIDVSFISLDKIVPAVKGLIAEGGLIIALIKPQFEAGPEKVGRGGIVRDTEVHRQVVERVENMAEREGLSKLGLIESPIKGADGNTEYLIHLAKPNLG
jgi:23S rRNA (cytidine1920-2'-O)/16S rRNA (cytidine1409-2'-O)-methyltransferase